MTETGVGIWRPVDGPPPQPRPYTLVNASRVLNELDGGIARWGNGVQVYPFPPGVPEVWDPCSSGSDRNKWEPPGLPLPKFAPSVVPFSEVCSSYGIWGGDWDEEEAQRRFVARATAAMEAVESASIEREFMGGYVLGAGVTPYLADGNGTFPWGDNPTGVANAIAVLENEIALTGRGGLIHCSPAFATLAARHRLLQRDDRSGTLQTIVGTILVPGAGYVDVREPHGHAAADIAQEWVYATGPVDVRRDAVTVLPDNVAQALDRHTNTIEYRAEREYVVAWDTVLQAAVLADLCDDSCGTIPT